jgi:CrcB protein
MAIASDQYLRGSFVMGVVNRACWRSTCLNGTTRRGCSSPWACSAGFTTFSAFSLDTIALIERGALAPAGLYVLASVALSIGGLYLGLLVSRGTGA